MNIVEAAELLACRASMINLAKFAVIYGKPSQPYRSLFGRGKVMDEEEDIWEGFYYPGDPVFDTDD